MESNVEDQNTPAAAEEPKAPRRRASRRVSAAAGATAEAAAVIAGEATAAPVEAAQTVEAAPAAETAAAPTEAAVAPAEAAAPVEEAPKKRATRSRKKAADADAPGAEASATPEAAAAPAATEAPAEEEAPKKRATRSRKKAVEPEAPAADEAAAPAAEAKSTEKAAPAADVDAPAPEAATEAPAEPVKRATRSRRAKAEPAAAEAPATEGDAAAEASPAPAAAEAPAAEAPATESTDSGAAQNGAKQESEAGDSEKPTARSRRARGRGAKNENADSSEIAEQDTDGADAGRGRGQSNGDKGRQNGQGNQNGQGAQNGQGNQGSQNGPSGQNAADNSSRSSRTRQRDRKRRGTGDDFEPEITEDDVLLPIAGILDVLDNYAFVRTSGYLPGTSDVYVSLGQVKKYGLRRGDAVVGAIRQPRDGESGSRQKYNAIVKIDAVNGRTLEDSEQRAEAADLTAIYPDTRLRFEGTPDSVLGRSIDLVAPIGLGQRGLIVLPARTAGTPILSELAEAVRANAPEAHLMMVLADAQPEDVTHLERSVRGEVVAATFDRPAEDQATVAELAIERAKRMLELGHDVVVLMDSLNRFARAYAQAQHGQARPAHDEIDEFALGQIMKLLAAARNVENGGSLTILATVQHGTGLPADQTLLREARRVANSEIRIGKARAGVAPTVQLAKSRTATAAALLSADEAGVLGLIRTELHDDDAQQKVVERIRKTASNAALLAEVQRAGGLS